MNKPPHFPKSFTRHSKDKRMKYPINIGAKYVWDIKDPMIRFTCSERINEFLEHLSIQTPDIIYRLNLYQLYPLEELIINIGTTVIRNLCISRFNPDSEFLAQHLVEHINKMIYLGTLRMLPPEQHYSNKTTRTFLLNFQEYYFKEILKIKIINLSPCEPGLTKTLVIRRIKR